MLKEKSGKADFAIIGVVVVFVFIVAGFLAALWNLDLSASANSATGVKVIVAILALGGVLFTAAVTLVGFLFKRSYDSHNLQLKKESGKRLEIETQRNLSLQSQAEKRLRMETAINAVGLMSTSAGKAAPENQQAGALFALASLDQVGFALALLQKMWPAKQIDSISATWVIDQALMTDSEDLQITAAEILAENYKLLILQIGYCWPSSLGHPKYLSIVVPARELILQTTIELLCAKPLSKWELGNLNSLFVKLHRSFIIETQPRIKSGAALALEVLSPVIRNLPSTPMGIYSTSGETVIFTKVEDEIDKYIKKSGIGKGGVGDVSVRTSNLLNKLKKWKLPKQK